MKKGTTKDGNPQLEIRFTIDGYPYAAIEIWTSYEVTFMVGVGGRPAFFNYDGSEWHHDLKDQDLAGKIIEQLIIGYESKQQSCAD